MKQVIILVAMITLGLLIFLGVTSLGDSGTAVTEGMNDGVDGLPQFGAGLATPNTTRLYD